MQKNLLTKFNTLFFDKTSPESRHRRNLHQHDKGHRWQTHNKYDSQWWKTESLSSKIRNKTRMPTIATIIQHSFGSPNHTSQRRKRSKRDWNWKRRIKTVYFADDTILYIENLKDATIKLLELIINLVVTKYKIKTHKSFALLYTNSKGSEWEIKETILFTNATQRIKYLGINLPSKNNTQLWMSLVMEARSDAIKSNIA